MRILAIITLVLAFAQPYIPVADKQVNKKSKVAIYIDNSFSTEADSKYGKLSQVAINKANNIVEAYPEGTKFVFCDNNFSAKHQHTVSREQVKDFIEETTVSPSVRNISKVIEKLKNLANKEKTPDTKTVLYLISDFQKNISDFINLKNDTLTDVYLIPLEAELKNNLFIDSVWFESPNRVVNQADDLLVKITNKSSQSYVDIPLRLFINDTLKVPASFNIEANESITKKLVFTNTNTGFIRGRAEITDYPVTFDNQFYFSYKIDKLKNILVIGPKNKNKFIDAVFEGNSFFKLTHFTENAIKISEINNYDVVIIDGISAFSSGLIQELVNFASSGGNLIIFSNPKANTDSYNKLFNKLNVNYITGTDSTKIFFEEINYNSSVLQNVFKKQEKNPDLPYITNRVKFTNMQKTNEETVFYTENNEKILSRATYGSGLVYVCSQEASEKAGNFVLHPLWAAVLYNMAIFTNDKSKIFYILGQRNIIKLSGKTKLGDDVIHITDYKNKLDFIPATGINSLIVSDNIKKAGNYLVKTKDETIKNIAFNYNRKESDIEQYKQEEIIKLIKKNNLSNYLVLNKEKELLAKAIQQKSKGKELWYYFIMLALLFLLFEIITLRTGK